MSRSLLLAVALNCFFSSLFSQSDSILHNNIWRKFILHLPQNYSSEQEYPLVLNFHGLGSSAFEQQLYSNFDAVADANGFVVAYPDGINNQWSLLNNDDVFFVADLVDSLRASYSINECLFSMGMSMGGFLSYLLACESVHPITAMACVTGNMIEFYQAGCSSQPGLPVLHFHGTNDDVVSYGGDFGMTSVEETVLWWAQRNQCTMPAVITPMENFDVNDQSTVDEFYYGDGINGSEVILYKINNGGHSWPGAIPIPDLGVTNQDIDASAIIGDFFVRHCELETSVDPVPATFTPRIWPNPSEGHVYIDGTDLRRIEVRDLGGKLLLSEELNPGGGWIDLSELPAGIYVAVVFGFHGSAIHRVVLKP
jgi:polyhydroxybutyrate depolymerase